VNNTWGKAEGTLTRHLYCGQVHDHLILLPSGTDRFRVSLQYTGSRPSFKKDPFKKRMAWVIERLPPPLRIRLPSWFRRWAGWGPDYVPSSNWRALTVEMPIPTIKNSPTRDY
jgi:hypothetical protein